MVSKGQGYKEAYTIKKNRLKIISLVKVKYPKCYMYNTFGVFYFRKSICEYYCIIDSKVAINSSCVNPLVSISKL